MIIATSKNLDEKSDEIKGASFFFIAIISVISIVSIFGSIAVWRMDRSDWTQAQNISGWKLDLIRLVAQELG